jgi:hypothetical protein
MLSMAARVGERLGEDLLAFADEDGKAAWNQERDSTVEAKVTREGLDSCYLAPRQGHP